MLATTHAKIIQVLKYLETMSGMNPIFVSLLIFSFMTCFNLIYAISCPLTEKQSLLNFKNSLLDPYNQLSSWSSEVDCCKWKGVICNNSTGHVHQLHLHGMSLKGRIDPSLVNLKHLNHLDLSLNNFGETIPSFIGSFTNLEYLNLSFAGFHGKVPCSIGNLSSLLCLDLAGFPNIVSSDRLKHYHSIHLAGYPQMEYAAVVNFPNLLHVDNLEWLLQLRKLEHLNMNFVNLSTANDWLQVINALPSLLHLHFQNCSLDYISSLDYVNITSLNLLDLSSNNFHSFEGLAWIFRLSSLRYLDLRNNSFIGPIPTNSNATQLEYIDLSSNLFNSTIPSWVYSGRELEFVALDFNLLDGTIPPQFTNLCRIRTLSLSFNRFQGKLSDSFGNMSECFLETLEVLNLQFNQLSGHLIDQLGEFKSLQSLVLAKNSFSGKIPSNLGKLSSLEILGLSRNKFTGSLPDSLGQLSNLQRLHIGGNKLEGLVTKSVFANLTKLQIITASENHLTLKLAKHWIPPFQLKQLRLGSWNLGEGSEIPSWLQTQKNLSAYLDLSDTGIYGNVPSWFWEIQFLNLSHNHLHGNIPDFSGSKDDQYMYLSCNQFEGSLPRIGDTLKELDLSNNSLSGGIAHFLCDERYDTYSLEILHLGDNLLSGELPDCWMKWPSLRYLNLGNNRMFGSIPASLGLLANLQSLNLDHNKFSGRIPSSMQNCKKLLKMGLADNVLGGSIPTWIGTSLVELRILILSSNNLSGEISSEICHLTSLQILDLSNNKLSGIIPRCLHNFTAMAMKRDLPDLYRQYGGGKSLFSFSVYVGGFIESVLIVTKGNRLRYDTILPLVTTINLSKNKLSGGIPNELTSLLELGSLNFSRNELRGLIPENVGDMKQLESLDLSRNSLSGQIPNSLASITLLDYLDLSYNNLTGRIPESTQIQSFNASSFYGNDLCGPPLTSNCSVPGNAGSGENEEDDEAEVEWFYVFVTLGYALGFSGVCTALVLKRRWRDACLGLVERVWNEICVFVIIKWRNLSSPSSPTKV